MMGDEGPITRELMDQIRAEYESIRGRFGTAPADPPDDWSVRNAVGLAALWRCLVEERGRREADERERDFCRARWTDAMAEVVWREGGISFEVARARAEARVAQLMQAFREGGGG